MSEVAAIGAENQLPAGHFAVAGTNSQPSILLNLPQPLPKNKTDGLVTRGRV
ncbi:hypothetical protein [Mycobacterium avium]|uniref:hypothetical protein n=1 Tax=Mycobacterium avium TaxID=1764 RepID=UPI001CC66503|nr:hypothetical protein [Mycobacterium avium]